MLGLRFCARAFSSCGKRGPLFIAMRGPLTIAASLVAEHRLQTRRLSSCGSRAQSLRGMRDLSIPGLEPVSPALAGRLPTTAPPGKPLTLLFDVRVRARTGLAQFLAWAICKDKEWGIVGQFFWHFLSHPLCLCLFVHCGTLNVFGVFPINIYSPAQGIPVVA